AFNYIKAGSAHCFVVAEASPVKPVLAIRQDMGMRLFTHGTDAVEALASLPKRHLIRAAQAIWLIGPIVLTEADTADLVLPTCLEAAITAAWAGGHLPGLTLYG